jgi:hypothetical protein
VAKASLNYRGKIYHTDINRATLNQAVGMKILLDRLQDHVLSRVVGFARGAGRAGGRSVDDAVQMQCLARRW